jgi:hypothetical protein
VRYGDGIERNPWNLTRFRPAEGARQSSDSALARDDRLCDGIPQFGKVFDERVARLTADGSPVTLRVPAREVALAGGNAPVRLYDTSGPQGHDVRGGLPKLREPWMAARRASGHVGTQLYYARRGEITPEMEFVSAREGCPRTSCARKSRAAARSSPRTSTTSSSSR